MGAGIPWSVVELDPREDRRVEREVERLTTEILRRWDSEPVGFGLSHGKVGLGFVMNEAATAGVPRAEAFAQRAVEEALAQFSAGGASPGLHGGIAGLGWLVDAWFGEEGICVPIDESLRRHVEAMSSTAPIISLREGLGGIGLYAARRADSAPSARALLEAVATKLQGAACTTSDGLTWDTPRDYFIARGGSEVVNPEAQVIREFGVAHGVASVALLLSQMERLALPGAVSTRETLRWLWSNRSTAEHNRFGWIWADAQRAELEFATWCTGDPGVALTTWLAARTIADPDQEERALALGRQLAQRIVQGKRLARPGRLDLCCGLAGVLQLVSSFAAATGEPLLVEATRTVLRTMLDELETTEVGSLPIGFMYGVAGIAAALLGSGGDRAPSWAALLAMTTPQRIAD